MTKPNTAEPWWILPPRTEPPPTIPSAPPVGMQRRTRPTEQLCKVTLGELQRVADEAIAEAQGDPHDPGDEDRSER